MVKVFTIAYLLKIKIYYNITKHLKKNFGKSVLYNLLYKRYRQKNKIILKQKTHNSKTLKIKSLF